MKVFLFLFVAAFASCMTVKRVEKIVAKAMNNKGIEDKYTIKADSMVFTPLYGGKGIRDTSKCDHRLVNATLLGCISGPCNTCTCVECGKKWTCY